MVDCVACVAPLPENWLMAPPRKIDGSRILVHMTFEGATYVDMELGEDHRGGPEYPRHFHRFEDYGLADGYLRCRKCGLVGRSESVETHHAERV